VGKDTEPLGPFRRDRALALMSERGHRAGCGVIEAEVQCLKFLGLDGRLRLHRKPRDDLAKVTVAVDDLAHGEPLVKEMITVDRGGRFQLRVVGPFVTRPAVERRVELIQKQREPVG
jgi:hypothetical protein